MYWEVWESQGRLGHLKRLCKCNVGYNYTCTYMYNVRMICHNKYTYRYVHSKCTGQAYDAITSMLFSSQKNLGVDFYNSGKFCEYM